MPSNPLPPKQTTDFLDNQIALSVFILFVILVVLIGYGAYMFALSVAFQ